MAVKISNRTLSAIDRLLSKLELLKKTQIVSDVEVDRLNNMIIDIDISFHADKQKQLESMDFAKVEAIVLGRLLQPQVLSSLLESVDKQTLVEAILKVSPERRAWLTKKFGTITPQQFSEMLTESNGRFLRETFKLLDDKNLKEIATAVHGRIYERLHL